ncbi:hypothetical protein ALC60_06097 [Trachymyrmex zeteki]|uniref:Uncharacterized protein n=1 Tax=Mycetomoellerius zeteki TaxID=64791 RepID=A0A151X487_9HYME|nr:hypothetical protein ALC60_06097 [Trachymyrmex zeteki]
MTCPKANAISIPGLMSPVSTPASLYHFLSFYAQMFPLLPSGYPFPEETVVQVRNRDHNIKSLRIVACQLREDPAFVLGAVREQLPTTARLGRPASTGVHTRPVEPVGGTRRRPDVTAQISATPVQDLSPFPEPGQSALASHRPSRCEGGTAPELRFSTFLSRVAHPTDEGGYPVRQLPPLMLSSVAAVERSQPQPPSTAPTPTAADPKLISNSSKRKGSMGRREEKIRLKGREEERTKRGGSEEKEQYKFMFNNIFHEESVPDSCETSLVSLIIPSETQTRKRVEIEGLHPHGLDRRSASALRYQKRLPIIL